MKRTASALYSEYIIDGVPQELSPGQMLDECLSRQKTKKRPSCDFEPIIDETLDPSPNMKETDPGEIDNYLELLMESGRCSFPSAFAATYTKYLIAKAIIDTLWLDGHFRIGDISLGADWEWNPDGIGNMAAFYESAGAASEYVDSLGLKMHGYSFTEAAGCSLTMKTALLRSSQDDSDLLDCLPDHSRHPRMGKRLRQSPTLACDPDSWILYVPFDNCEYGLGGSTFSEITKAGGDVTPEPGDPDYFLDSYELLREMVEDGVLLSGATVGDGGLMMCLKRMSQGGTGATIDLSGITRASGESDIVRILFAEVPGAVIQIRDSDFDYVDAEFTLQDVAFYTLGHPSPGDTGLKIESAPRSSLETILESLLRNQASEGED